MKGSGIIGAYHTRRVAPLMSRALPLYLMVPRVSLDGTTLTDEALSPSEVAQHIKEAMEPSKDTIGVILYFVFPVPRHPNAARTGVHQLCKFLFSPCLLFN